jgi:hypothetical protein
MVASRSTRRRRFRGELVGSSIIVGILHPGSISFLCAVSSSTKLRMGTRRRAHCDAGDGGAASLLA